MHDRRHSREETNNRRGTQLRFDPKQNTGAASNERCTSKLNCEVWLRNLLCRRILREFPGLFEMVDAAENEISAEQQASE